MFLEKSSSGKGTEEQKMELEIRENDEAFARPLSQILSDLRKPIPAHIVHTRQQGGRRIKYLSMEDTIAILDQYAPGWEGTISTIYNSRDRIYIAYRINDTCERRKVFKRVYRQLRTRSHWISR